MTAKDVAIAAIDAYAADEAQKAVAAATLALQQTIDGLQKAAALQTAQIASLTTTVNGLNATVADLKAQLAALQPPVPPVTPPAGKKLLLGTWDESPDHMKGTGTAAVPLSNYAANFGFDQIAAKATGTPQPVSAIMHGYGSGQLYSSIASSPVKELNSFGKAALLNHNFSNYADVLTGGYDAALKSMIDSIAADQRVYITWNHEPDNSSKGTDATAWCKAIGYAVNFCAPLARAKKLTGGFGGLLMGWTFGTNNYSQAIFDKWNWLQYVKPENLDYAVYMMDNYSKFLTTTTWEDAVGMCDKVFALARVKGCKRFGIGETAISLEKRNAGGQIIGTEDQQVRWVADQVPKMKACKGLEFVIYFHKPTGPESKNAKLTGKSITAWSQACVDNKK